MKKRKLDDHYQLTTRILIAMIVGALVGMIFNIMPQQNWIDQYIVETFYIGGQVFLTVIKIKAAIFCCSLLCLIKLLFIQKLR